MVVFRLLSKMKWKEASSLILFALKEKPYSSLYNYNLLMLKRSEKSSFMPNAYVFPGGTVDSCDSNPKWKDIFTAHGYKEPFIQLNILNSDLPPILKTKNLISNHVSLRITAIRETFEETGILLCRGKNDKNNLPWGTVFSSSDVGSWRLKVQNDPSKFYDLCQSFRCVPDIWALKLWSNWLTPPHIKKRFDTIFFIACLLESPQYSADGSEISDIKCYSPDLLMKHNAQKHLWLPPPQFYELSRIMRFHMLEDFADFATERENKGCERVGTNSLKTKEGSFFPMPGDGAYGEENVDCYSECTFLEARNKIQHINRMEFPGPTECRIISDNANPSHGHVLPISNSNVTSNCCQSKM